MSEIKRIIELHELHGSIRRVSKQLGMSRNTVKKYLERVQNVKQGVEEEIVHLPWFGYVCREKGISSSRETH